MSGELRTIDPVYHCPHCGIGFASYQGWKDHTGSHGEQLPSNPSTDFDAGYCAGYESAKVDLEYMGRLRAALERARDQFKKIWEGWNEAGFEAGASTLMRMGEKGYSETKEALAGGHAHSSAETAGGHRHSDETTALSPLEWTISEEGWWVCSACDQEVVEVLKCTGCGRSGFAKGDK